MSPGWTHDLFGERGGTRTRDPMIKSHVLYRLSYALTPTSSMIPSEKAAFRPAIGGEKAFFLDHAPARAV